MEICKQIFRCCELTGNVSYCTELLDNYRQKVLKLGTWRSANSVRVVRDAAGTTSILMKGKSYNRGMQTHKLCLEAFFWLVWPEFVKWYTISSSCEQSRPISQEQLQAIISSGVAEVEKWENIPKVCISQTKRRSEGLALCIRCI